MSHVTYVNDVGSLIYTISSTTLEITHVVGVLRKYISKLGREYWTKIKNAFKYLCGTIGYGLCYHGVLVLHGVLDIHNIVDAK